MNNETGGIQRNTLYKNSTRIHLMNSRSCSSCCCLIHSVPNPTTHIWLSFSIFISFPVDTHEKLNWTRSDLLLPLLSVAMHGSVNQSISFYTIGLALAFISLQFPSFLYKDAFQTRRRKKNKTDRKTKTRRKIQIKLMCLVQMPFSIPL